MAYPTETRTNQEMGENIVNEDDRVMWVALVCIAIFIVVCTVYLILSGCTIEPIWEFGEIPDLGIQTIQDAMWWVSQNIIGMSDSIHYPVDEYWQSPTQTYIWRTGDCEDYCILVLYLIHRDIGIDGEMACGERKGIDHAWVYVDGHYWEPQTAQIVDGDPDYELSYTIGYEELIRRATTTHRRLEF